jgi:putative ABC transport system ATP-binding protein
LILADEPTGALDSVTSNEVMTLLRDINKEGITIVIVTH